VSAVRFDSFCICASLSKNWFLVSPGMVAAVEASIDWSKEVPTVTAGTTQLLPSVANEADDFAR
jgi:hypothetical protein